jgi:peptidoglycan/xylan/chitin deacetylase (PgdA/CDA1 family)
MPTAVFARHMRHVAEHFSVLTVDALVDLLADGRLPRRAVAITFDDGYRDNLVCAAPILARHGLPATVFLATGFIGTGAIAWFDELALAFRDTTADAVITPWGDVLGLATLDERLRALAVALGRLKRSPDDERREAMERLVERLGGVDRGFARTLMLGWDDVRRLRAGGFSIGAHTVTHPILSRVSVERAAAEILGSRTIIEAECGVAPRAFAYPNGRRGDYDDTVVRLVREAGFACALTTRFGVNTPATPRYELRRGGPWETDLPTFALKMASLRLHGRLGSAMEN